MLHTCQCTQYIIKHDFKGVCNDKCIIIIYTIACLIPPILPAASKPKVRWKPPDANLVKINFDGAIFKDENSSGIGVVVRDHTSAILVSLSQSLSPALQPAKIEAIIAARALEFGQELDPTEAVLEGDSELIMNSLKVGGETIASVEPLI